MTDKIKLYDFIEIDYTGKLVDGTIFDTTLKEVAKKNGFYSEKNKFEPVVICVGEKQILPGLDKELMDKELGKEYEIKLQPEDAFGKRDIRKIRIIPMNTFREHKLEPQPGLQINVDGELGTVTSINGGRVLVNFNHPLAGKEVVYNIKVHKKITDAKEKIQYYMQGVLRLPKDQIQVEVNGEKAEIKIPMEMPAPLVDIMSKKVAEVINFKEVKIGKKETEKKD